MPAFGLGPVTAGAFVSDFLKVGYMRFAIRTLLPIFAVAVSAIVTTVSLSGRAAGQNTDSRGAAAPSASAAPASTTQPSGAAPESTAAAPAPAGEANAHDLLEKGKAALQANDYVAAATAFSAAKTAAEQTPGLEGIQARSDAIVGHGLAMAGLKEYTAALSDYDSIIVDEPNNLIALISRGQARLEVGRVEDALSDYQKVLQLDLTNAQALFGTGKALEQLGRSDEAIMPLTRAIAADPKNAEAYRLRGRAYSDLFKNKQAIEDLQQAIQLDPNDFEAYFALGVARLRSEDYQDAIDQFGKAIEHYKPKSGQEDQPFLQGYLTRAAAYIELGKIAKDPAAQKAAYQAAADEAQKIVTQLDAKNPGHAKALAAAFFTRGIAERMLGQIGTAIRTLTQAIDLRTKASPDDATNTYLNDVYFRRGICFLLIGEDKMAISDFQAAAHLILDDPRANLWEGFCYAKMGKYHEALRAYGDAIAASDRYTPAYYNRALAYMMLADYEKAIADFNDAIRLEPANAEYYFKRGVAYEMLGDNQKASESFAAAIEFDNTHAQAYRHMADVLQRLGRSELATQYRQYADQLAPPKKPQ